ncbi:TPA: protein translocase subunit SecDF [Listeria monocytogenes]|uniref:Multifunctional fusion protein n=1 Tax=Listeria monocytogenes TaxID=1639 RepID=A0A9P3QR46_LISMN|nr:protein translocase subunit SecDF [Listeria monocytogenes]EAE3752704.1 protein translocase subunit SecDF [Listeria monocytogenes serotype 1/2a]EAG6257003.1 protein translocase subunit SecDF [Listeria monocytogenes CFSAN003807]ADB68420.1 bifunctional preprotein translocase subunit SecD/SecF [Listeria monocytogenes 08-5578]ADB71465.1 bifunctional preprotein translocase subunit SecD/SecF [Listeria monocytogenes 08-5923]AHF32337.1 bifunctional preprotein translocase subunit SecD/SecF [Listeria 
MVKKSKIVIFFLVVAIIFGAVFGTAKMVMQNINLGLDLQGGFEVLYEVSPADGKGTVSKQTLTDTVTSLDKRVNSLGVAEPSIQIEGNNRIRVQLAGVTDQAEARKMLSTTAQLSFRDANDKMMMNGSDLVAGGAKQAFDSSNNPIVTLKLKSADKFASVTKTILAEAPDNQLVIWLDWKEGQKYKTEREKKDPAYLSAPNVSSVLDTDKVEISGSFTTEEAKDLAELLNSGALPVKMKEVYSTSVGAQFGQDALQETILAGIIGVIAIFIFMMAVYRLPGVIACITLVAYTYLVLLILSLLNATLTLPGIAGLILGIGMAVDANVITYERIKEEIKVGRSTKAAFEVGGKEAFRAILDGNLTTLIVAAVLFYFGTSSIKGFATVLIISILVSFLTAVWGSRFLLGLLVKSNWLNNKPGFFAVKRKDIHNLHEGINSFSLKTHFDRFDFVKHHRLFLSIFAVIVIVGIVILSIFKLNLGIDFASGTRAEVTANQTLTETQIKKDLDAIDMPSDDIVFQGSGSKTAVVSYKGTLSQNDVAKFKNYFEDKYKHEPSISTVSPTVGKELAKNGFWALGVASVLIVLYIAVRFEFYMGIAAILSLLFDAFIIFIFFSVTRLEVDLTFIAAVLTVIGYSINDTIVTADRIRDISMKMQRFKTKEEIADAVNKALRQTFTRSINTILTVIFTVLALVLFGSESILNFSIALLVGLVSSVFSSIFMAMQLWYVFKARQLRKKGPISTVKKKKPRNNGQPVV